MKKQYSDFLLSLSFMIVAFILSGIAINAYSQTQVEPSYTPCDANDLQCDLDTINTYLFQMTYMPYDGPYPDPPQGGCGMDNPNWFAFVAGDSILKVTLDVRHCTTGSSGPGVQMTIYDGDPQCSINGSNLFVQGLNYIAGRCNPPMDMGTYTYVFSATPGHTYYILLDGWSSSLCEININIEQGGVLPALDQPVQPGRVYTDGFNGPDSLCLGAKRYTFSIDDFPIGAAQAIWVLPNGDTLISELGSSEITIIDSIYNFFSEPGEFELCVSVVNPCDQSPFACRTYYIDEPGIAFSSAEVCYGEIYNWLYDIDTKELGPGGYIFEEFAETPQGCLVEYHLELTITPFDDVFIEPLEGPYCIGDVIEITGSHDSGKFYTDRWDDFLTDHGDGTATFITGAMDFVHLFYTYTDTVLGCSTTADYIISNITPLPILYNSDTSIESGDSAIIGVQPEENVVYSWSTGETGSYISVTEEGDYTLTAVDTISGCENSIVINVTVVVSVISIEETKLNLYPNPFKNMLTIESLDYIGRFKLMNSQSVIYTDGMFRQGEILRINSSSWPPGTYYMILEGARSIKLIKQ